MAKCLDEFSCKRCGGPLVMDGRMNDLDWCRDCEGLQILSTEKSMYFL